MFTDEPSPFLPRRESHTGGIVVASVLVGALGGYAFSEWRHAQERSSNRATPVPRPALTATPPPMPDAPPSRDATPRVVVAAPPPVPIERRATAADRSTIYLCRPYSGGSFWSSASCHTQRATIDRMTTVPADLPFEQQVAIASGQAREAAALYTATTVGANAGGTAGNSSPHAAECAEFDAALRQHDAEARQPQSAQSQDWLRQQRIKLLSSRRARGC